MKKLCRPCCGDAPTFVRSDKSRQKRICGAVPPLCQNRKLLSAQVGFLLNAHRRQLGSFIYHRQSVNALLLTISFPLPPVWLCLRSQIHVGSLEGFNLSPANSKRFAIFHILSFANVAIVEKLVCAILWLYFCINFDAGCNNYSLL